MDLWPVSLDLPAGRTLVVTGPNGCGKSTLLAVLARHLDPWTDVPQRWRRRPQPRPDERGQS